MIHNTTTEEFSHEQITLQHMGRFSQPLLAVIQNNLGARQQAQQQEQQHR
jgi:hypothetical protein